MNMIDNSGVDTVLVCSQPTVDKDGGVDDARYKTGDMTMMAITISLMSFVTVPAERTGCLPDGVSGPYTGNQP